MTTLHCREISGPVTCMLAAGLQEGSMDLQGMCLMQNHMGSSRANFNCRAALQHSSDGLLLEAVLHARQ